MLGNLPSLPTVLIAMAVSALWCGTGAAQVFEVWLAARYVLGP